VDGKAVKKALIDKDMTQRDLAEKMGVSYSYVSALIRNEKQCSLAKAKQICGILDKKLDDLF